MVRYVALNHMIKAKPSESLKSELEACFILCHQLPKLDDSQTPCSSIQMSSTYVETKAQRPKRLQSLLSIQHRDDASKLTRSICHVVIVLITSLNIFAQKLSKTDVSPQTMTISAASLSKCPLACALDSARDLRLDPNAQLLLIVGHCQENHGNTEITVSSIYFRMMESMFLRLLDHLNGEDSNMGESYM